MQELKGGCQVSYYFDEIPFHFVHGVVSRFRFIDVSIFVVALKLRSERGWSFPRRLDLMGILVQENYFLDSFRLWKVASLEGNRKRHTCRGRRKLIIAPMFRPTNFFVLEQDHPPVVGMSSVPY